MHERDFHYALAARRGSVRNLHAIAKAAVAVRPAVGDARIDRVQPLFRNRLAVGPKDAADAAQGD